MTPPASPPSEASPSSQGSHGAPAHVSPRSDLIAGFIWMALGVAILIGSLTMDRLKSQDINPYTVPGLLPGLLGIVTILLGFLLTLRSWRRVAQARDDAAEAPVPDATSGEEKKRIALVLTLCLAFGVLLVGHGLPFWAAASIFVTVAILSLQHGQRKAAGQPFTLKVLAKTLAIGIGAGIVITLVFQDLFLVHLP